MALADSLEADHAVTWARELPHTTNRRQALQHAFYIHARSDPATAREHLREVEPNQAHAAATRAWAHGVYTSSGRRALTQWRIKEEDAGNRQLASMIQASEVNILAAINPNLVSNTILDLPPGDHKDALLHELIDRTYQRSREHALTAKQWLSELEDYSRNKTWTATIDQLLLGESWDMPLELPVQRTASLNAQTFGEFSESLDILARMPHDL